MTFFQTIKGYKTYGMKADYRLLGRSVMRIIRESEYEVTTILGFSIKKEVPPPDYQSESNEILHERNKSELKRYDSLGGRRILFVVQTLESVGGVETRLLKLFKFLESQGWAPALVTEKNNFEALQEYPNFYLNMREVNASQCFYSLVQLIKPNVIEFQLKEPNFFHDVDIQNLKSLCRVGVCLHGQVRASQSQLDEADYRILSNLGIIYGKYKYDNFTIIPNFIDFKSQITWKYSGQKRALLITRISKDKYPSIVSFVRICQAYQVPFEIAGDLTQLSSKKIAQKLQREYPNISFIGAIDTMKYLQEKLNEFLFIGGVGQVAIEAGTFGIPVLIPTHWKDYKKSIFMNKKTVHFLQKWNFVLRVCPKLNSNEGKISDFFEKYELQSFDDYNVIDELKSLCDQDKLLNQYLKLLSNDELQKL